MIVYLLSLTIVVLFIQLMRSGWKSLERGDEIDRLTRQIAERDDYRLTSQYRSYRRELDRILQIEAYDPGIVADSISKRHQRSYLGTLSHLTFQEPMIVDHAHAIIEFKNRNDLTDEDMRTKHWLTIFGIEHPEIIL